MSSQLYDDAMAMLAAQTDYDNGRLRLKWTHASRQRLPEFKLHP